MANTSSSFDLSTAVPIDATSAAVSAPPAAPSSGFDLSTATPIEDKSKPKTDDKPSDQSTDWMRQIALAGRAVSQGVVNTATAPISLSMALPMEASPTMGVPLYAAKRLGIKIPTPGELFSQKLTDAGAPTPESSGEQLASAGISGLTGGLTGAGAFGIAGLPNAIRAGAAGSMGGTSQEGARQMGLPPWMQAGAGLLGSQLPALGESTVRTLGDLLAPLTSAGQSRAAGTLLNSQAQDPAAALANLQGAKPIVPGSEPTAGAASQDAGLLGVEKAMRGRSAPEFGQQSSLSNAARQAELTSIGGTPNDLNAAIAARSQATAPLYAAAAQQSAPIDSEMVALMQRPAMQAAIAKAKETAENSGRVFGLSSTAPGTPMSLSGADLQGMKLALDDMRSTSFSQGIGPHQQRALEQTSDALKSWMQQNVPMQRQADAAFQNLSGPINKMTTVQGLKDQASTNTADTLTGQYMLSPSAYDKALDKVLADPRNGLAKADITRLEAVRKDLQSSVASSLLKAPGSDTFQNLSLNQNIGGGVPGLMMKPLGPLYKFGGADEAINKLLTRAMLDPKVAGGLMQRAKMPKSDLNFRPFDLGTIGGLLGSSP